MHQGFSQLQTHDHDYVCQQGVLSNVLHQPLSLAYTVLLIVQTGHAKVDIRFQSYQLKPGDVLVLAEDDLAIVREQSTDFLCDYYLLNRQFAAEVAYALPNTLFVYLNQNPYFAAHPQIAKLIQAWQYQAHFMMDKTQQHQRTLLCNHLQNFFLLLTENIDNQYPIKPKEHSRKEKICWRFWEMVAQHSTKEREVSFYAKALHITPYDLAQLCQQYFNDSPKTLIDRQVILQIKQWLLTTTLPIQSIADNLHFNDASYMNRYFKKHTHCSLRQYRQGAS
jgi:YesN/AraC family two-component response regulator